MQKLKIFSLLQGISAKEMIAFKNHLERKYQATDRPIKLFNHLRKYHPDFSNEKKLNFEYVYQFLFDSKPEQDKKLDNLYSDLVQDLEDFLLFKKASGKSFETQVLWLSILKERNMNEAFSRGVEHLDKEFKVSEKESALDYFRRTQVKHLVYNEVVAPDIPEDINRLKQMEEATNVFYWLSKLKIACRKLMLNRLHNANFSPESLEFVVPDNQSQYPLLHIYIHVYQALLTQSEDSFQQAVSLVKAYIKQVEAVEMAQILDFLLYFSNAKVNSGVQEYWRITLDLIQLGFNNQVYSRMGALVSIQFNNFISIACRCKDFDWADIFIKKQAVFLQDKNKDDTVALAKVTLQIEKDGYIDALQALENKKFKEISHVIRAKAYILMCHYALNHNTREVDITLMCSTFDAYLRRHQDKHPIVLRFINFSHILKMMAERNANKAKIHKKLDQTREISSREWLEKMLHDYKQK